MTRSRAQDSCVCLAATACSFVIASGCCTALARHHEPEAVRTLERAGNLIAAKRYVEAVIECRERSGSEAKLLTGSMLFGPGKRIRVDYGGAVCFFDGSEAGNFDPQVGEVWKSPGSKRFASPVMMAGMIMGGATLPLPAAREYGDRWWRHLYGQDAIIESLGTETIAGAECSVIRVQPQDDERNVVWWIEKASNKFVRYRVAGSDRRGGAEQTLQAAYTTMRFPAHICDDRFRNPRPESLGTR